MQKCRACAKEYSREQKREVLHLMFKENIILAKKYPQICLKCIQKKLTDERDSHFEALQEAARLEKEAHKAFVAASIKKRQLQDQYSSADRQSTHIKFFEDRLKNPTKPAKVKASRKKKSNKKLSKSMRKLLAQFSPEQLAIIADKIN